MLFSSTFFLLYFLPVFFTIYFIIPTGWKNYFIVFSSLLFYAWGAPLFVFVLLASIVVNFYAAHIIYNGTEKNKKIVFVSSIILNVSFLLYFKYVNFFIENFNVLVGSFGFQSVSFVRIALPIGISFFTFHQLSFIIDIYRRVKPPMKKISDYALYILLFPQLIAGPIIRYNEISDQIQGRDKRFHVDDALSGLLRFSIGLAKKVLIANVLGQEADRIFSLPADQLNFMLSWIGAITYTFQIYFDFSGYSDMAIGLAKMMGFTFPENFNHPYIAQSITDFWRRWHISLSRWMRDYLYIPLGGNKVSNLRLYFNLWLVFLISGFWHGAEWTFIEWGAYHGFFLAMERLFLLKLTSKIGIALRMFFTFFIVVIGWVIFRAENMTQAFTFIKTMFSYSTTEYLFSPQLLFILSIAILLSFIPIINTLLKKENKSTVSSLTIYKSIAAFVAIIVFMTLCIGEITSSNFNPFIYFKF